MRKLIAILAVIALAITLKSCLFLFEDTVYPKLNDEKDAYYAIVEAHALKQVWMYNYIKTFSNNYSQGQLFEYEPTQNELDNFLGQLAELMTYEVVVDSALIIIQNAEDGYSLSKDDAKLKSVKGLFSSMSAFYKWGRNAGKRARERTELIISNMTDVEKTQLFNELLRDNWKNEFTSEAEFWTKLKNGELDDKAPQIYNDFYYNSAYTIDNNFVTLANDKGLTPGKIVAKEGAEGIEKGAEVYVEAAKIATPLGKGADVLDEGKKWWEKAEKAVDKPMELVKDEIKERLSKKLAGYIDIDGAIDAAGLGEGTGSVVKGLMELSLGSSDPAEIIQKGMDLGIAKLSQSDSSIVPELVVAEKGNADYSFPTVILGVGNYVNELGETLLTLPSGTWNMTAIDSKGNTDKVEQVSIVHSQYTQIEFVDGSTQVDNEEPDNNIDDIDFPQYPYALIGVSGSCAGVFFTNDHKEQENNLQLNWSGNNFSVSYDYIQPTGTTFHNHKGSINGSISKNEKGELVVTMQANETEWWPWGGIYEEKKQVAFSKVPISTANPQSFSIDASNTPDLMSNFNAYVSYSFNGSYSMNGEIVQGDPANRSCNNFNDSPWAYISFRY